MSYVADRRNIQFMFIFGIFANLNEKKHEKSPKVARLMNSFNLYEKVQLDSNWIQLSPLKYIQTKFEPKRKEMGK